MAARRLLPACGALEPIPDKLVVLPSTIPWLRTLVVRPLLNAIFRHVFHHRGFTFPVNKTDYMTWEQIAGLNKDGFEIGNHTRTMSARPELRPVGGTNRGHQYPVPGARIPRPTSLDSPAAVLIPARCRSLKSFACPSGRGPEYPYDGGRGCAYEPGVDHPLLIPSAGDARPYRRWKISSARNKPGTADRRVPVSRCAGPRSSLGQHAA